MNETFSTGDYVHYLDDWRSKPVIAKVIKTDLRRDRPLQILFQDGDTSWFRLGNVKKYKEELSPEQIRVFSLIQENQLMRSENRNLKGKISRFTFLKIPTEFMEQGMFVDTSDVEGRRCLTVVKPETIEFKYVSNTRRTTKLKGKHKYNIYIGIYFNKKLKPAGAGTFHLKDDKIEPFHTYHTHYATCFGEFKREFYKTVSYNAGGVLKGIKIVKQLLETINLTSPYAAYHHGERSERHDLSEKLLAAVRNAERKLHSEPSFSRGRRRNIRGQRVYYCAECDRYSMTRICNACDCCVICQEDETDCECNEGGD